MAGSSEPIQGTPHVRIRPLVIRLVAALVAPVALAFWADRLLGASPWITLATLLICLPIVTVLVLSSALRDMDAVIAAVAPEETGAGEAAGQDELPAEATNRAD